MRYHYSLLNIMTFSAIPGRGLCVKSLLTKCRFGLWALTGRLEPQAGPLPGSISPGGGPLL